MIKCVEGGQPSDSSESSENSSDSMDSIEQLYGSIDQIELEGQMDGWMDGCLFHFRTHGTGGTLCGVENIRLLVDTLLRA